MAILFGPVSRGGTGTLLGIVLCVLAVIDLLVLPLQIAKFRSGKNKRLAIILTAVSCVAFATLGLMSYFGKI